MYMCTMNISVNKLKEPLITNDHKLQQHCRWSIPGRAVQHTQLQEDDVHEPLSYKYHTQHIFLLLQLKHHASMSGCCKHSAHEMTIPEKGFIVTICFINQPSPNPSRNANAHLGLALYKEDQFPILQLRSGSQASHTILNSSIWPAAASLSLVKFKH